MPSGGCDPSASYTVGVCGSTLTGQIPHHPTYAQQGKNKQGVIKDYTIDGNSKEYKKKVQEAKPWMTGNELAPDKIISVTPSDILPLAQDLPYAKQG